MWIVNVNHCANLHLHFLEYTVLKPLGSQQLEFQLINAQGRFSDEPPPLLNALQIELTALF